jgi:uncharacterized protein (TIGR03084 family)
MTDVMADICADLAAEQAELTAHLRHLAPERWLVDTPAVGWTVRDQIAHLAYFDEQAVVAATDPERFTADLAAVVEAGDLGALERRHLEIGRAMGGADVLAWWERAAGELGETYRPLDPATRIPWYGPAMAARSKVTARIMETWAHGQDVRDALGVTAIPTGRLAHVCHIGVRARPFSFQVHGLTVPAGEVHLSLVAPDGAMWEWGDAGASETVEGPALDFALLVTQRRHRDDLALVAKGAGADAWLDIAQAFAGPPGPGRRPGQFAG